MVLLISLQGSHNNGWLVAGLCWFLLYGTNLFYNKNSNSSGEHNIRMIDRSGSQQSGTQGHLADLMSNWTDLVG